MLEWWQWFAELAWWLRLVLSIAAFFGGALLAGWVLALAMLALRRQASPHTRLLTRLSGGMAAGVFAWLLLQFAPPGTGGAGGNGTSVQEPQSPVQPQLRIYEEEPPPPLPPDKTQGPLASVLTSAGRWQIHLKLLGDKTNPRFEPPDKYFMLLEVEAIVLPGPLAVTPSLPSGPINAKTVLQLIRDLQKHGTVEAVQLHVTPVSTSLKHNQVGELRRLLSEAKIRFDHPDPDNPQYSPLFER